MRLLRLLAFAGMLIAALHHLVAGDANWSLYLLAAVPLLVALVLVVFHVIRGHYNASLDKP